MDILERPISTEKTVLRLVKAGSVNEVLEKYLSKALINEIGHANIIDGELKVLEGRGLEWALDSKETQRLISLPVPEKVRADITVSRRRR